MSFPNLAGYAGPLEQPEGTDFDATVVTSSQTAAVRTQIFDATGVTISTADKNNRMVALRTFLLFFSITSRHRSAPTDLKKSKFDVTIYSGGYETTLGMRHPASYDTYGELLHAVNVALAKKHNGLQVDYVYNCTEIGDVKSQRLLGCWGENTNTLRSMIQTKFARNCMEFLHDDLRYLSEGEGKQIGILMLCRSGKHRSVAAAAMFRSCLRCTRRFDEIRTVHLSENRWPRHFCTTCVDCRKDAPDRDDVQDDIAAMWSHELSRCA